MSTPLQQALEDYLTIRRQLGYQLHSSGRLLDGFVRFAEQAGARTITTELAVAWARQPQGVAPIRWSQRLGMVRGFAGYLATIDPETEIPTRGRSLGSSATRRAVYLLARGDRGADGRCRRAVAAGAGGDDANLDRAARLHRDADW